MKLIVPYRNRLDHLKQFVQHYKGFDILVVEQANDELFNRGKLLNIGFNECTDDVVCFHDVDLLAEGLAHYNQPIDGAVHFSGLCEQFNYKVPYDTCFGGVTAFTEDAFLTCNGFSNNYRGWGGEDDDLFTRTKLNNIRTKFELHRYKSLKHEKQPITSEYKANKERLNRTQHTWEFDGLNSLRYKIVERGEICGVELIKVDL